MRPPKKSSNKAAGSRTTADYEWRRFEKAIYDAHVRWSSPGDLVKHEDRIKGVDSGIDRKIDISVRSKICGHNFLMVVECKDQASPIDVRELGSFSDLVKDVRAAKGVMISTSGYTKGAIELARSRSIDAITWFDAVNEDWTSKITIPILMARKRIHSFTFMFLVVPGHRWALPTHPPHYELETFSQDFLPAGKVGALLARKWNAKQIPLEPGRHHCLLAECALILVDNDWAYTRIEALVDVEEILYLGNLPIKVPTLPGGRAWSLFTASTFETAKIERGEVPGWQRVESQDGLPTALTFHYADTLKED